MKWDERVGRSGVYIVGRGDRGTPQGNAGGQWVSWVSRSSVWDVQGVTRRIPRDWQPAGKAFSKTPWKVPPIKARRFPVYVGLVG